MNMPVPVVEVDPGPDWANHVNACLSIIDSHNHTPGQGVQITPAGMLINADLPFNGNNAISLRSTRYSPQVAPLSLPSDLDCLYVSGVDLYYNDGAGNQIRVTQSGSVTGSAGTITGLPSGTASASYSAGTFTFNKATLTPATMNVGDVKITQEVSSGFGVTISANPSQSANYNLVLPLALPAATSYLQSDTAGNLSFGTVGYLPLGSVIATFPSLTGAYTTAATTTADSKGFVLCVGQTISDVTSPMNGAVIPNINNFNFVRGSTVDNVSGGAGSQTLITANLPSHTHTFTSSTVVGTSSHTHTTPHVHQWSWYTFNGSTGSVTAPSNKTLINTAIFTNSGTTGMFQMTDLPFDVGGSNADFVTSLFNGTTEWYTAGAVDGSGNLNPASTGPSATTTVAGTTDATGSGTSFSIIPSNISAVYLMRVK